MKNILKLSVVAVLAAFLAVGLSACGGGSPSDVAVKATKFTYDGKGEKVLSLVDLKGAGEMASMAAGKLQNQATAMKKVADQNGGVAKIEVVDEQIDGDNARVKVKISFKSGAENVEKFDLVKINGDWKISI